MSKQPMTVKELREALAKQPDSAFVAWVNDQGTVGYFYAEDQEMNVDNGHVHLELGGCPPASDDECDHGKREDEECSACEHDRMSDGITDGARL